MMLQLPKKYKLQLPKKYNTHQAKAEVNIGLRGYLNQRIDRIDRKKTPAIIVLL